MKLQNILTALLFSMGLTSCMTNMYQVYEVQSPNLVQKENSMVFENEDCKLLYSLWCENGSMQFIFENKTNSDLFVDMNQTFFIKNGAAYNYYNNRTYQTQTFTSLDYGYSTSSTYWSKGSFWPTQYDLKTISEKSKTRVGISTGISTKEAELICIPAKSFKVFNYYTINPEFIKTCDKKIDYPKKQSTVETYNEHNTPLTFKNRISYSFNKTGESLQQIENTFWLAMVKNYSRKAAIEEVKEKKGCSDFETNVFYFKIGGPNQFYKEYKAF